VVKRVLRALGRDNGTVPERALHFAIDPEQQQVGVAEEGRFSRVADFGPLYENLAEMRITPATSRALASLRRIGLRRTARVSTDG
jgi:hypothetical protein